MDSRGDFFHTFDFRQIYASVLSQWFGVPNEVVRFAFPKNPQLLLPLIKSTPALEAADFTGDGKVEFDNFLAFARGFSDGDLKYDLDGDGKVGFSDFLAFAQAYGAFRQ